MSTVHVITSMTDVTDVQQQQGGCPSLNDMALNPASWPKSAAYDCSAAPLASGDAA